LNQTSAVQGGISLTRISAVRGRGGGGIPPATAKRQVDRLISAFGDIAAELAA
jgi:hypothetical protein